MTICLEKLITPHHKRSTDHQMRLLNSNLAQCPLYKNIGMYSCLLLNYINIHMFVLSINEYNIKTV